MTGATRFEKSIETDASQQRVWDVLSDLEAWPRRIEALAPGRSEAV